MLNGAIDDVPQRLRKLFKIQDIIKLPPSMPRICGQSRNNIYNILNQTKFNFKPFQADSH